VLEIARIVDEHPVAELHAVALALVVSTQLIESDSPHAFGPLILIATESKSWVVVRAGASPALVSSVCTTLPVRSSDAPVRKQLRQVAFSEP